jgi:hypothetical protein
MMFSGFIQLCNYVCLVCCGMCPKYLSTMFGSCASPGDYPMNVFCKIHINMVLSLLLSLGGCVGAKCNSTN